LTRAYAGQVQHIEQLTNRVKTLEAAVDANRANGQSATPGTPGA
jgi:hypothetical protein